MRIQGRERLRWRWAIQRIHIKEASPQQGEHDQVTLGAGGQVISNYGPPSLHHSLHYSTTTVCTIHWSPSLPHSINLHHSTTLSAHPPHHNLHYTPKHHDSYHQNLNTATSSMPTTPTESTNTILPYTELIQPSVHYTITTEPPYHNTRHPQYPLSLH